MLIPPPLTLRPSRLLLPLLLLVLVASLPPLVRAEAPPAAAPAAAEDARKPRPPGLVVLQKNVSMEGTQVIGVFAATADPSVPGLWSVRVWDERRDQVFVATDKVRCSPDAPMRITGQGGQVFMRELNPGGPIISANRLDHLIWWAVCHPEQAGKDPAGLSAVARSLGYPGTLPEREQILPGR
ncbi:MAG: hypothetical protein ACKO22_13315 [Cyanobium sp.]